MMVPSNPHRVFLAVGSTDMRKSINGLSMLVEQALELNPFSGDLFVFCNQRRTIIKILYYDTNGFCLWLKRLEEHRFKWPEVKEEVILIGAKELSWLLAGLDYTSAHGNLKYLAAC
jgi:transposase